MLEIHSNGTANPEPGTLCSFNLEVADRATAPLIYQSARFLFVNGGAGTIRIQHVDYELRAGALVAILPWQISNITAVHTPLQYAAVVYRFETINQTVKAFFSADSPVEDMTLALPGGPVVYCNDAQCENVRAVLFAIRDEVGNESTADHAQPEPKIMSGIYTTSLLVELIVLYLRIGRNQEHAGAVRRHHADPSEILHYMYNHLSEKLTLEAMSRLFYISEYAISKFITQTTGLSFFDLLNEMRIGKMANFLLYTDLTLKELAEILGFVDTSHLSKAFSSRTGLRVNEYRKTYQRISDICKVKASKKAYEIIDFLYHNYSEPLTPQKVAALYGISAQELQRILLYQVERSFDGFLNYLRVNRASALLLQTDKHIIDIAMETGYNSVKTFARNFLKLRGVTPSEFRKTIELRCGVESGG